MFLLHASVHARAIAFRQLMALNEVLKLREVRVYDIAPALSRQCAREMSEKLGLNVTPVDEVSKSPNADVTSTATPSKDPYIRSKLIEQTWHAHNDSRL